MKASLTFNKILCWLKSFFINEKFNPLKWQGKQWGLYYEIDRNKSGVVTLVPSYGWDKDNKRLKNHGHWTCIERNLSDLTGKKATTSKPTIV